ncbi:hypothetical protein ACFQ0M_18115 [Kitasatospora aburaviensis]
MTGGPSPACTPLVRHPSREGPADHEHCRRTSRSQPARLRGRGGNHDSLNPYLTGGGALFILLLLLYVTTRFNRDR